MEIIQAQALTQEALANQVPVLVAQANQTLVQTIQMVGTVQIQKSQRTNTTGLT